VTEKNFIERFLRTIRKKMKSLGYGKLENMVRPLKREGGTTCCEAGQTRDWAIILEADCRFKKRLGRSAGDGWVNGSKRSRKRDHFRGKVILAMKVQGGREEERNFLTVSGPWTTEGFRKQPHGKSGSALTKKGMLFDGKCV